MLDRFRGCLLGAAIGDALGMPGESGPTNLSHLYRGYRKPWKWHPNARLDPGQYTDDTQVMLLVTSLLASGTYSEGHYADALARLCLSGDLRFPDGSLMAACERLVTVGPDQSGVNSDTAGCIPLAVPFALKYADQVELSGRLAKACSVTHTHPAALAGTVTVGLFLSAALRSAADPLDVALRTAAAEDPEFGTRTRRAVELEHEGISLESALTVIGNDVSVYQTVPITFFLISRYENPENLLYIAANIGGNTDTIAFICGAYVGAKYGESALPPDLLKGLENRDEIRQLAGELLLATPKH
nr:ADP-ribosylglycohydrolase family protein [Methanofollis sp. W23]